MQKQLFLRCSFRPQSTHRSTEVALARGTPAQRRSLVRTPKRIEVWFFLGVLKLELPAVKPDCDCADCLPRRARQPTRATRRETTKNEFHVDETVDGALKTVALHYGVHKTDVPSLQLESSKTILTRKQQLTASRLCDESQCHVLGVHAALEALEARKAKAATTAATPEARARKAKALDIVQATWVGRWADLQLVCKYTPEKTERQGHGE